MSEEQKKQRVLSCIQPSGMLTLGNYLGALKNWKTMSDDYDCLFAVADLHTITVRQDTAEFRKHIYDTFALLLAIGLDPQKNILFLQSNVSAHAQLAWVLNCYTQFGELGRMTQFKEKSLKHADNVNAGLFTYPVLMAADILLYQADLVPVGADQKQHLEITRDIATRFNNIYGDVFTIPEAFIGKEGAKIMSLADPTKKMSKSDENQNAYIAILDDKDTIIRKFKRAVTDSEAVVRKGEGKDGINNLITIYSTVTGKSITDTEKEFEGIGYGDFKLAVGEAVAKELAPIQEQFAYYRGDKAKLEEIYRDGAKKAEYLANKTLGKVMKKVGFIY
ncbi:MAG: tryptophan--tRNA ligase [Oscillospiraceae bacterium]|nr:tryptophan--tRNA ligase [Candidatus Equicaccousia limihippi]